MAKPWDDSMKMLVRANPQALVSLLLPGAKFQGEQDKELKARTVEADLLYELWEVPTEMLKQKGLEGLLPLLPLTQGGKSRKVVEETIAQLQATGHQDLLALSYVFAALIFTKSADKLWLKERFEKMHDILEGSWAYQEIMGKGHQQGILAMQQTAINIVRRFFADLEELAKTRISAIEDLERLQQLILDLSISHTREQMEQVLLSLDA